MRVPKYDSKANLEARTCSLRDWGHDSSVWYPGVEPPKQGHVVENVDPYYVSRPCWEEIYEAADLVETVSLDLTRGAEPWEDAEVEVIYRFFFLEIHSAKAMALKVQASARNRRKDNLRRIRLDQAGGFHDKQVIHKLFEIQQGRCYYSGAPLIQCPKTFCCRPHSAHLPRRHRLAWELGPSYQRNQYLEGCARLCRGHVQVAI